MARESRMQNPAHAIVQTQEEAHKYDMPTYRRLGVFAEPVNMYVDPGNRSAAWKLAESLNSSGLVDALDKQYKRAREGEELQGMQQAAQEGQQDKDNMDSKAGEKKSLGFYEGYMKIQATLAAQKDSMELQERWEKSDKSVGFDQFSKDFWKEKGEGIQDRSYLSAYAPIVTKTMLSMRHEESQKNVKAFIEDRNGSFQKLAINTLMGRVQSGEAFTMQEYEGIRDMATATGITKAEANHIFAQGVHKLAQDAHSEDDLKVLKQATELLGQNHTDGTPGFSKYQMDAQTWYDSTQKRVYAELNAEDNRKRHELNIKKSEQADVLADTIDEMLSSGKNPRSLIGDERFNLLNDLKVRGTILRAERMFKQYNKAMESSPSFDSSAREALTQRLEEARGDPEEQRNIYLDARATYGGTKGAGTAISAIYHDANARNPFASIGYKDAAKDLMTSYNSTMFSIGSSQYAPAARQLKDAWERTFYETPENLYLQFGKKVPEMEAYKDRPLYKMPPPIQRQIGYAIADQFKQKTSSGSKTLATEARPSNPNNPTTPQKGDRVRLNNGVVVTREED